MGKQDGISNVLYVSDLQCGSKDAICPPNLLELSGATYVPSDKQLTAYNFWCECWEWAAELFKGEKFILVLGSEIIQGVNRRFATIGGLSTQAQIAQSLLLEYRNYMKAGQLDRSYLLQGTEIHTGLGQDWEELVVKHLADELKIKPNKSRHTRQELLLRLPNGALLQATHHFNATSVYPLTAYQREYREIVKDRKEKGKDPPDILYRCHIHQFGWLPLDSNPLTEVGCFTTPGWQLKNTYTMKSLSRWKLTQMGMCATRIEDNRVKLYRKLLTITPGEDEIETA